MVSNECMTECRQISVAYLQNSQLVHLAGTSWYHILQDGEFLVHLGSPSPLDEAMCRLPGDLPPCGAGCGWLLLLCWHGLARGRGSSGPLRIGCAGCALSGRHWVRGFLLLLRSGFHLDDLARSRGRRRQREVAVLVAAGGVDGGGRSPPRLDSLTGLYPIWGLR